MTLNSGASFVNVTGGSGTFTFTNRFGTASSTAFTFAKTGVDFADNVLLLNTPVPVDGKGLTLTLASGVQLPGANPSALYTNINLYNTSSGVYLQNVYRIDTLGSAWLSTIPGFTNVTIGASNINALAPNYATCQAPISFTNGLRAPTQPSAANGAVRFLFTYTISDGATYQVQGNLTMTATSAFATTRDSLGNPYQTIVNITGTRTYTYYATGETITSQVTGITNVTYAAANQRFYPYALLSAAPGVYNINSAPFFDYDGVEFSIVPSAPKLGANMTSTPLESGANVYYSATATQSYLTEGNVMSGHTPLATLQQQSYILLA